MFSSFSSFLSTQLLFDTEACFMKDEDACAFSVELGHGMSEEAGFGVSG